MGLTLANSGRIADNRDLVISIFAPVITPGVLDNPVVEVSKQESAGAVPNHCSCMCDIITTSGSVHDSAIVELETVLDSDVVGNW